MLFWHPPARSLGLPIGCLVGDQAYHCCVVCKHNDGVGVVPGHAVVGEQGVQERTEHAPLGSSSVEDQRGRCVATWGQPVRKSSIKLQREVLRPRILSLVMIFVGTMVLNAEL